MQEDTSTSATDHREVREVRNTFYRTKLVLEEDRRNLTLFDFFVGEMGYNGFSLHFLYPSDDVKVMAFDGRQHFRISYFISVESILSLQYYFITCSM